MLEATPFEERQFLRKDSAKSWVFPGCSDGKASVCNAGDPGSIPGLGRSPEKEMATYFSTLAWKIPWREEPGRLQSMGLQKQLHFTKTRNKQESRESSLLFNIETK